MAAFNKFNQFVADLSNKVHNLGSDSLKIYLSNTAPAATNAIKTDIEAHLGSCDLTPAAVAKRQGISESYIRKLFESEDTSFSEFVLGRRLFQAYRLLSDRRQAERSIASIAFGVGFGDLSYFCRTFKRAYGQRPSELRGRDNRSKCP